MKQALETLERLREGNRRYVAGEGQPEPTSAEARRRLVSGQNPSAIVLGCSDSRVPAELVFDQGVGELFVIRVAGNIVAPSQVGSVEFAASSYGTPLVVVLGHTMCGAVLATLDELEQPKQDQSPNLRSIVGFIRPAVEPLLDDGDDHDALVAAAVRANIRASAQQLREGSDILMDLVARDRLLIVGAEYSLETGVVDFFDGVPAT
jgi:carbonic anhydrase